MKTTAKKAIAIFLGLAIFAAGTWVSFQFYGVPVGFTGKILQVFGCLVLMPSILELHNNNK
jgi:hypothetical protein